MWRADVITLLEVVHFSESLQRHYDPGYTCSRAGTYLTHRTLSESAMQSAYCTVLGYPHRCGKTLHVEITQRLVRAYESAYMQCLESS